MNFGVIGEIKMVCPYFANVGSSLQAKILQNLANLADLAKLGTLGNLGIFGKTWIRNLYH